MFAFIFLLPRRIHFSICLAARRMRCANTYGTGISLLLSRIARKNENSNEPNGCHCRNRGQCADNGPPTACCSLHSTILQSTHNERREFVGIADFGLLALQPCKNVVCPIHSLKVLIVRVLFAAQRKDCSSPGGRSSLLFVQLRPTTVLPTGRG